MSKVVDLLSTFDTPTGKERGGAGGGAPAKPGDRSDKASSLKGTPISLADARKEAARKLPVDRTKYQTIRSLDELKAWIVRAREAGRFAVELKANSIDPMQADICGIALALAPNDAAYVPLAHKQSGGGAGLFDAGLAPDQIKESDALDALKPLLESAGDPQDRLQHQVRRRDAGAGRHHLAQHEDVQLMSYALDAGRNAHGLDTLAELWLGHTTLTHGELIGSGKNKLSFDQVAIDRATAYSAEDADVIVRLWRLLKPRLVADRMSTVYETLERPLVSVLARMERRGISIDRQVLSRLSGEFAQTAARVEAELQELAGEPINVGSPKQIGDIIFGKMGIPGGVKTKTGAWSTSAQILDDLAEQGHDFPKKILEWRQVSKLKSTYTDALPEYVNPQTHRVHTTYALAATTTGRLSSNEPNLQNIPVRTEDGRKIRRAFIATPGHKLVSADYSQIELRLARRNRRRAFVTSGVPRRTRHPRHDGVRNVRRANQGHAERGAAPGESHQFRHHLRHLGLRAGQPARHRARGGVGLHQEIFRTLPGHPRLYG